MKKFYLETYGCKLNQSDSDLIRGILSRKFNKTSDPKEADFIVINSCGVVEKTERKIIKRIKSFKNKKIIISGCLPLISSQNLKKISSALLGPQNILSVERAADSILAGKKFFEVSKKELDKSKYCFLKKRKNSRISAIVSISEGCLGSCTYCAARKARGNLKSFGIKHILKEIEGLVSLGYKEIQLSSQDSSIFGLDKGEYLLPELLNKICKIKGDFKIRLGMMNPGSAKVILKDLISAFKSEKIYKFLHLPLQSGDDKVLKAMNRSYRIDDFLKIIQEFKKNFKDFLIATDIILGFPAEDQKAFLNTKKIIDKIKPGVLHIFRFSPRRNTLALEMKDLSDKIKKDRSRILTDIFYKNNLKENKKFLGKKIKVLVAEKRKNNTFLARTPSFRAVILKNVRLGEKIEVKIKDFRKNFLMGEKLK